MRSASIGSTLIFASLMLAATASAMDPAAAVVKADTPDAADTAVSRQRVTLENKLRLVKVILSQSPAAQRISQSNNAEAKKKLANAQALFAKAEGESQPGNAEAAIRLLDDALRQLASASALVPDVTQLAAQERTRNTEVREAIRSSLVLLKNITNRAAAKNGANAAVAAELGRIESLAGQADKQMASGNQREAKVSLLEAFKLAAGVMDKVMTAETIVYDLKFETPAAEYQYEHARNLGYEELIPIAFANVNAKSEMAIQAERYVQESKVLRESAQKKAGGGDYPGGIKMLQDATTHLQRSLRLAGVVVSQSPETQP